MKTNRDGKLWAIAGAMALTVGVFSVLLQGATPALAGDGLSGVTLRPQADRAGGVVWESARLGDKAPLELLFREVARKFPEKLRVETRTVMGYSPYRVEVYPLIRQGTLQLTIEKSYDLTPAVNVIVTASDRFDAVSVDHVVSKRATVLRGKIAEELNQLMRSLDLPVSSFGVVSVNGTPTIYHLIGNSDARSDLICGSLSSTATQGISCVLAYQQ